MKLDNRYVGLSEKPSIEGPKENLFSMLILIKDFMMLDSVGTTELLAATLYDKFV